jgi:N-acetylglucosaminyl-diphospho-decaprenol L-rhamnosyltransferase
MSTRTSTPRSSGLGVVTVVHGRREHAALQRESLRRSTRQPDVRVVVAMDDEDVTGDHVVHLPATPEGRLPVAAARNLGARTALARGADTLVFLDVDCLVATEALAAYDAAVRDEPDVLWSGPVTYLRPGDRPYPLARLVELDEPHPARPAPEPGERLPGEDWSLFWSLSFALSASAWERTGGFDEAYTGYGAEDTDFAQRARAAGLRLGWDGDARAYHQYHPTQRPPVQHVDDLVRNGALFAERWGWWPMTGWLEELEELGLVVRRDDGWEVA